MALPKIVQKLFSDEGKGSKLRPYIIPTTINGNFPDSEGNFTPNQTGCLPLGGGKMAGAITTPSDGALSWTNGAYKCTMLLAGEWGTSAGLSLRSKDATSETGFFNLLAADSTQSKLLQGRPDGILQWGGNNVITSAGGKITGTLYQDGSVRKSTNNNYYVVMGGSNWDYGAYLQLNGSENSDGTSDFCLASRLNGKHIELRGKNDGTLTWGGKSLLTEASNNPVGTVIAMAANSAPSGYLLCNGSAVSRTTYADLFAKIGTTYGKGDGSTTFNLPNLTDKFIQGSGTAGTSKSAGLPNITASFKGNCLTQGTPTVSGAITVMDTGSGSTDARHYSMNSKQGFNFSASNSNSIYGASTTVQPPALTMRMYIKY